MNTTTEGKLIDVTATPIWDDGQHDAFVDLVEWKGYFYCVFRSAPAHLGGVDEEKVGEIIVIRSADLEGWQEVVRMPSSPPYEEIRDPHLLALPTELRLYGIAWNRAANIVDPAETKKMAFFRSTHTANFASATQDGVNWTELKYFCPHYAFWRPRFYDQTFYTTGSFALGPEPCHVDMFSSKDGYDWRVHSLVATSDRLGDAQWSPCEGEMLLLPDQTCLLFVRRSYNGPNWPEIKPEEAQWWPPTLKVLRGKGPFPDIEQWETINESIHVEACASLYHNGSIYVAGRDRLLKSEDAVKPDPSYQQWVTSLYRFDMDKGFEKLAQFPETDVVRDQPANDCAYPGLVAISEQEIAMAYYSSHEGSTNIYLAKVNIS